MSVVAAFIPRFNLIATTAEPIVGKPNLFKIAFRGFEDKDHWILATKSLPGILSRHNYTQITLHLDEKEQQIWVLDNDIRVWFTETPLEIENVLQYFPIFFRQKLLTVTPHCTKDPISDYEMGRMVVLGKQYLQEPAMKCIRKQSVRTLIAGQGQSFVLFSKFQKKKDPIIGSGSIKRVKLALKIQNAQIYAAAICRREFVEEMDWKLLSNEVELLSELRGISGILQLVAALEDKDKYYILTEYFNCGDLQRVFDEKRPLTFKEKLQMAIELTLGLSNLHYMGIIHRDLKPSNMFVSVRREGDKGRRYKSVIGDLGSACKQGNKHLIENRTGTLAYIAPEKLASFWDRTLTAEWVKYSTHEADMWSLGMILFSLFHPETGSLMEFQTAKRIEERIKGLTDEEIVREIDKSGIDKSIRPLIQQMLQLDYRKRCTAIWLYKELKTVKPPEAGAIIPNLTQKLAAGRD